MKKKKKKKTWGFLKKRGGMALEFFFPHFWAEQFLKNHLSPF